MKKLLLILTILLLLFTSCSKEEQSYFTEEQSYFTNELDYYLLMFDGEMVQVGKLVYYEINYTDGSREVNHDITDPDGKITLVFEEGKVLDWFNIRTDYAYGEITNRIIRYSFSGDGSGDEAEFLNEPFTPNSDNVWGIYVDTHSVIINVNITNPLCYTTWKGYSEGLLEGYTNWRFFWDGYPW